MALLFSRGKKTARCCRQYRKNRFPLKKIEQGKEGRKKHAAKIVIGCDAVGMSLDIMTQP